MDAVETAIRAIDAANRDDPHRFEGEPLALVEGRLAHEWIGRLDDEPTDALLVAARAHHLRRWVVPRSDYPDGRNGYLRWRRDQKTRHATELRVILDEAGVGAPTAERAAIIVAKKGLGSDPEVQTFEDAVCLTFLHTQLAATAERLGDERAVPVIAKTLSKMSEQGREVAMSLEFDDHTAHLVARALESPAG